MSGKVRQIEKVSLPANRPVRHVSFGDGAGTFRFGEFHSWPLIFPRRVLPLPIADNFVEQRTSASIPSFFASRTATRVTSSPMRLCNRHAYIPYRAYLYAVSGRRDSPIRNASTPCAASRPSAIAHTISDWPRRASPAANTPGTVVW